MKMLLRSRKMIAVATLGLVGLAALILLCIYLLYPAGFESLGALAGLNPAPHADYYPTQGWRSSAPEAQGIDSNKLAEMLMTIRSKNIPVHSMMIIRNGYVVVDATFYPYDGEAPHNRCG